MICLIHQDSFIATHAYNIAKRKSVKWSLLPKSSSSYPAMPCVGFWERHSWDFSGLCNNPRLLGIVPLQWYPTPIRHGITDRNVKISSQTDIKAVPGLSPHQEPKHYYTHRLLKSAGRGAGARYIITLVGWIQHDRMGLDNGRSFCFRIAHVDCTEMWLVISANHVH
ncbi:hypothetical protein BJX70DRAFT_129794 [Aspergillus crustosus]